LGLGGGEERVWQGFGKGGEGAGEAHVEDAVSFVEDLRMDELLLFGGKGWGDSPDSTSSYRAFATRNMCSLLRVFCFEECKTNEKPSEDIINLAIRYVGFLQYA
jgi:hypothetical protein